MRKFKSNRNGQNSFEASSQSTSIRTENRVIADDLRSVHT